MSHAGLKEIDDYTKKIWIYVNIFTYFFVSHSLNDYVYIWKYVILYGQETEKQGRSPLSFIYNSVYLYI